MNRERALDSGLAASVLIVTVILWLRSGVELSLGGFAGGVCVTIALEWLLSRHSGMVRAVWERPAVRVGSLLFSIGTVVVLAKIIPAIGLSFVGGMASGYLLFVGLVELGLQRTFLAD